MNSIKQFLADHPLINTLVRMVEAAVVMTVIQFTASGFNWQATASWKGLGAACLGAVVVAVRNWLIQSPLNPGSLTSVQGQKAIALILIPVLAVSMVACSTSWIQQAEAIVTELTPVATNILQLVFLLENKTLTAADVATVQKISGQIGSDFRAVGTLLQQYQAANAQGTLAQINAALTDAQQNLGLILTATHISDPATVAKIQAIVGIAVSEVQSIQALIPKAELAANKKAVAPPMNAKQFKAAYAKVVNAPTGSVTVDAAVEKLKVKGPHLVRIPVLEKGR
jgi:hypothetical protein